MMDTRFKYEANANADFINADRLTRSPPVKGAAGFRFGRFYMALRSDSVFNVNSMNGFEGEMTADALGLTACLYAFSNLSFGHDEFAETCAGQYHLLREYMFGHAEVRSILRAID